MTKYEIVLINNNTFNVDTFKTSSRYITLTTSDGRTLNIPWSSILYIEQ